jgi:hypothetical protein
MVGIDALGILATAVEEFLQPFVPDAFDQFPVFLLSTSVVYGDIAYCARCKMQRKGPLDTS